ncbi:DUF2062 domain-containing protein [bacterium]|nr:DUF2062 domain-containing protein [candidate division CSSED10-310 bacterium]
MSFLSLRSAGDLKKEFSKRTLRQNASYILSLKGDSHWLSLSFAIGVLIGTSPFYGTHTVTALVLVSLFRFNLVTTIIGAWLSFPPIQPFIYYVGYRLGRVVLRDSGCVQKETLISTIKCIMHFDITTLGLESRDVILIAKQLLIGCTLLGVVAGIAGYFFLRISIDRHRARVSRRYAQFE